MLRKYLVEIFLSFFYSLFLLIGISFQLGNNLAFFLKYFGLCFPLIFIILFWIVNLLFNRCDNWKSNFEEKKDSLFNDKPFLVSLITIILGWLVYIIAFYPAILSPDPSYQILQFLGIDNKYSYYSVLLDEKMIITNHHPVIHTLLLGGLVKVGILLNNPNLGLFLYSLVQIIILASTLSYTIVFMKKLKISLKYRYICLFIYAFVPMFPLYAMSPVKDVIFSSLIVLYIIMIWSYITDELKVNFKKLLILLILIILFRNNGIHVIILSLPFLLLINSKKRLNLLATIVLVLTFNSFYHNLALPFFKITPTSVREMLSIPFQQTARYALYYDNELSKEDKKGIDNILNYKTLALRYNPEKADPVKNEFNRYATKDDLSVYFKIWKKHLMKHPLVYIEATLNNTYGYYYPLKTNWYVYYKYNDVLVNHKINYHYNILSEKRLFLRIGANLFPYIPFLGLIVNIGFNTWVILFMLCFLFYRKKYKELLYLFPSLVIFMVCLASPVNTYFRYALPNILAMPVLIAIFSTIIRKDEF